MYNTRRDRLRVVQYSQGQAQSCSILAGTGSELYNTVLAGTGSELYNTRRDRLRVVQYSTRRDRLRVVQYSQKQAQPFAIPAEKTALEFCNTVGDRLRVLAETCSNLRNMYWWGQAQSCAILVKTDNLATVLVHILLRQVVSVLPCRRFTFL